MTSRGTVLTIGNFRQTITVVRSLGRAGFEVVIGREHKRAFTEFSRYASGAWAYDGSDRERFYDELEGYLQSAKPAFVFPVGEFSLERLERAAGRFERLTTCVMPCPATVAQSLDKRVMNEIASALGVPVPVFKRFTAAADWERWAREMGYPVLVKRKDSFALVQGKKARICRTPAEFGKFLAAAGSDPDPSSLILQKWVGGIRHNCHFAAVDGRIIAFFQQAVLRTDVPDGTGYGVEGISVEPSPELRAHCERLVGQLAHTGVGCVQFLVDAEAGSAAFLELNPRLDAMTALPYRCGFDFPRLAVEIAAYRRVRDSGDAASADRIRPATLETAYPVGKRSYWFFGDILGWLLCVHHREVTLGQALAWVLRMCLAVLRSRYHLTWELRDPFPTLYVFAEMFVSALKRLVPKSKSGKGGAQA